MKPQDLKRVTREFFYHHTNEEFHSAVIGPSGEDLMRTPGQQFAILRELGVVEGKSVKASQVTPAYQEKFDTCEKCAKNRENRIRFEAQLAEEKAQRRRDAVERRIANIGKHENCMVCSRPLTDPESVSRSIGPDCFQKLCERNPHLAPG